MLGFRRSLLGLVSASVLALGGCASVDGVELNGGIFDMMGISKSALSAQSREKQMAARPGIVMPPNTERLPPPGPRVQPVAANGQWPVGPEDRAAQEQAQKLAAHKAFCDREQRKRKTFDKDAAAAKGPLGSCDPGLYERYFSQNAQNRTAQ